MIRMHEISNKERVIVEKYRGYFECKTRAWYEHH